MEIVALVAVAVTFALWLRDKWRLLAELEAEIAAAARAQAYPRVRLLEVGFYDQDQAA